MTKVWMPLAMYCKTPDAFFESSSSSRRNPPAVVPTVSRRRAAAKAFFFRESAVSAARAASEADPDVAERQLAPARHLRRGLGVS